MLAPYIQSLAILQQQVEILPVCAAHTLKYDEIKALYEEVQGVSEQNAPLWLASHQVAMERLSQQVNEYYTSQRLSGPGYIYGVRLPQPQSLLERVHHATSRVLIQDKLHMLENLAYTPEFRWLSQVQNNGEDLLEELDAICLEEAERLVARLNQQIVQRYLDMGFPDATAFNRRFSIYAKSWVGVVRADFCPHLRTMVAKDLALLRYVNPTGSDQRILDYYATLKADPSLYSVEFFERVLERRYQLAAWLQQQTGKLFGNILDGLGQMTDQEVDAPAFLVILMEKLAYQLCAAVGSMEKDDILDRYLCQQVVHEIMAPVKIKASTGDLFALYSKEMPAKEIVAAPHRSIMDLLHALKGTQAHALDGEEPIHLNLVGFEHRLENMDPLTARITVGLCYRDWLAGIKEALAAQGCP